MDELSTLTKAIECINNYQYRLKDTYGNPGGLIELPADAKPIIIGDLHSNLDYLKLILDHEDNRKKLESDNNYVLVILGDAEHNDQTGHMLEMESSMKILDFIFELIVKYYDRIIYIRGNHDTFDPQLRKSGIAQGLELKRFLVQQRGEEYTNKVEEFFNALPYFIIGNKFVITHAGPIRGGATREELIDINGNFDKQFQLMWNRLHEFRGNPSLKEYGENDIRKMLEKLHMPEETTFIVGHNPLWSTGDKTGVWMNVIGIKNHHILYSGYGSLAPYFIIENELRVKFAFTKTAEASYDYRQR